MITGLVFVVESQARTRGFVRNCLEEAGCAVRTSSADRAITTVRTNRRIWVLQAEKRTSRISSHHTRSAGDAAASLMLGSAVRI